MADSWDDELYSLTISSGGYRFYGLDPIPPRARISITSEFTSTIRKVVTAVATLSVESSVTSVGTRLGTVSSLPSGSGALSVQAGKDAYASVQISGLAVTAIVSLEEVFARASLSSSCSVSVFAREIVHASASITGNSYDSSDVYDSPYPYNAALAANVVVIGRKLIEAASQVSGELSSSASAIRMGTVSADLSIEGAVLTLSEEILYPDISISISANVSITTSKFAYSASSQSASVDAAINSYKIAKALQLIDVETNAIINTYKIAYANTSVDGISFSVIVGKEILLTGSSISITSNVLFISPTRFSPNIVEDTQLIRTLLLIDNKPITEHNRKLSTSITQSNYENSNWSARRSRYYKSTSGRKMFSLSWSMLPDSREDTVDLKFGRDYIESIARDPDVHTIKFLNMDSNDTTPYTEEEYSVIVKDYTETLNRRDISGGIYWWDCSLTLEEV